MIERRVYRREPEEKRREALIAAALDLIADGGPKAATVRAIADRAGVTPGLIRHYFTSKDDLSQAAYRSVMDKMTDDNAQVLEAAPDDPLARLAVFVAASLMPPVLDTRAVGLWAGFIHQVRSDPALLAIHEVSYLRYRDQLMALIAALPGGGSPALLRARAIACNAVIDGLWLEGSVLPEAFGEGELVEIALRSVGAILGVDLAGALPHVIRTAPVSVGSRPDQKGPL
jgi:TetR/AcrR family transcriptional regulator, transcriptional repressor of bet genes